MHRRDALMEHRGFLWGIMSMFRLFAVLYLLLYTFPAEAQSEFGKSVEGMAEINNIRVHASSDVIRIVVDADKAVNVKSSVSNNVRVLFTEFSFQ